MASRQRQDDKDIQSQVFRQESDVESRLQHGNSTNSSPKTANSGVWLMGQTSEDSATRKSGLPRLATSLQDSILMDVVALVLSSLIIVSLAVMLSYFDGKRQPRWQHVSLNTIVSWLSTISKGCILLLAGRALGQLKWVWFSEHDRRLSDLRTFDMASRGMLGSIVLLARQGGRHVASLGCVAFILSFAFDPFMQNLVHYELRTVADMSTTAYLANNSLYSTHEQIFSGSTYYVDTNLKANVYSSLMDRDPDRPWAIPHFSCASGNCTWEAIPTLTAEYSCEDLTPTLKIACGGNNTGRVGAKHFRAYTDCAVRTASGLALKFSSRLGWGSPMIMSATSPSLGPYVNSGTDYILATVEYIIANHTGAWSPLHSNLSNSTQYLSRRCSIYPCVRRVVGSVHNGKYAETYQEMDEGNGSTTTWCRWIDGSSHGTYRHTPALHGPASVALQPPPWQSSNLNDRLTLGISDFARMSLINFLVETFKGEAVVSGDILSFLPLNPNNEFIGTMGAFQDVLQALFFSTIPQCPPERDPLECAMGNVAKALTKSFRDAAYIKSGAAGANLATGKTLVQRSFVHIQWSWLAMPLLIWSLTCCLWMITCVRTWQRKLPMWRNNPLPLLFIYRPLNEEERSTTGNSSFAYTKRAKSLSGQLQASKNEEARLLGS